MVDKNQPLRRITKTLHSFRSGMGVNYWGSASVALLECGHEATMKTSERKRRKRFRCNACPAEKS